MHPLAILIVAAAVAAMLIIQPKNPSSGGPARPEAEGQRIEPAANPAVVAVTRAEESCRQRHERFNARAKQGHEHGDIDVIFMGDSITEGWETEGKDVWAKRYAPRHAVNCGIGGDETQHLLWRIQNGNVDGLDAPLPKDAKPPHLIVVMIGTNNLGNSAATPEQTAAGVKAVLGALREKLPHSQVLLLAIFPRGEKPDNPLRLKVAQTNRLIKPDAEGMSGVHFLDIGEKFIQKDGTVSKEIMPDALHLSPAGYEVWAQAIEAEVHRLTGEQ